MNRTVTYVLYAITILIPAVDSKWGLMNVDLFIQPFHVGRFLFMHNGMIGSFLKVKRSLLHIIDDSIFSLIRGTTDSEHAFMVREPAVPLTSRATSVYLHSLLISLLV